MNIESYVYRRGRYRQLFSDVAVDIQMVAKSKSGWRYLNAYVKDKNQKKEKEQN